MHDWHKVDHGFGVYRPTLNVHIEVLNNGTNDETSPLPSVFFNL